jgi:hypothetical protein
VSYAAPQIRDVSPDPIGNHYGQPEAESSKRVFSEVDENDLDNVFHLCDRRLRGVSVPHASTGIARAGNGTG